MQDRRQISAATTSPARTSQWGRLVLLAATRPRHLLRCVGRAFIVDWYTHKYVPFALFLLCIMITVVGAYYLNHPHPESTADTSDYLFVMRGIQTQGQLVTYWRLPGYPLLIVLVYALAGQGNLLAVSVAQAVLFVLASLELYIIAILLLRRSWLAFFIGLLVGTNLTMLSFVKLLMPEALALWLLTSLALVVTLFVFSLRARYVWLVMLFTLMLFLTRPEWIYLPVPLFAYLLLVAARQGVARRLLPHVLVSVVLLYVVLGNYTYINAMTNDFAGVSATQNYNMLGKVLQYDMQDEAPPEYAPVKRIVDRYVARGIKDIYYITHHEPTLIYDHYALAGEYAQAIIKHHPGEFLAKSVPLGLFSLTSFRYGSEVAPTGPFGSPLVILKTVYLTLYGWNMIFPVCAALWLLLLCWRRTAQLRPVQAMGAIVLLTLYGLIVTTLGVDQAYHRVHVPFNPLLILVVWGTLLSGVLFVVRQLSRRSVQLVDRYSARGGITLAITKMLRVMSRLPLLEGADLARKPLDKAAAEVPLPTSSSPSQLVRFCGRTAFRPDYLVPAAVTWLRHRGRSVGRALIDDWRTHKYVLFALLLLVITTILVVAYYLNHPQPQVAGDTHGYLVVAQQIQARGQLVDAWRLPGYPLLIVLVYALAGQNNLFAVCVAQTILFVLATLELYVLAILVLRRAWLAFLIGLLVGTNLTLLFYVKLIMSEALALWLLVSLALTVALFVYTPRARTLWLAATFILALLLTRPEWIYVPVPLFGYLLLISARHGAFRRLLPHVLVSLVLLYAMLGNYIYINAMQYQFTGVTAVQNINLLGKVLQYGMQDEAPSQYATASKIVDSYVAQDIQSPWVILDSEPSLAGNYGIPASEYAWAIIERHPEEFLAKSVPVALWSLTDFSFPYVFSSLTHSYSPFQLDATDPFGIPLLGLQSVFIYLYSWNMCFPLCAALWLLLLCWPRTRQLRSVQVMGAVVLLALYGLILTTLGGYGSYPRLHAPFAPLLILVVWGTLLTGALLLVQQGPRELR